MVCGLAKFVPAVVYLSCLTLPGSFLTTLIPTTLLCKLESDSLEGLLVGGVDLSGDAVVVVGELPDELLLGVCQCEDGGHGQNKGEGCSVHFGAMCSRGGCCKMEEQICNQGVEMAGTRLNTSCA